jgi:DNA-binding MarR family transcriptional regulator
MALDSRPHPGYASRRLEHLPYVKGMTQASSLTRKQLLSEVVGELTAHTPSAMMRYMRRWPPGPLSLVHLHVLSVLDTEAPIPMRALAESLDVSQASATGIVDRMEQRGLVERRRDEDDRRVIRVALTETGRRMIEGLATERRERLAKVLEELTDDELEGFLRGSRALRRARERLHATLPQPPAEAS